MALYCEPDADAALAARVRSAGVEIVEVAEGSLAKVLDLVNPRSMVAVAPLLTSDLATVLSNAVRSGRPLLALVGLQDPGNTGTLLRVAEATGCAGVVLSTGSVDVWNPKVVRASAGSILRVPVVEGIETDELLAAARGANLRPVGTTKTGGVPPESIDLDGPVMLVVGSEAHGLPAGVVEELELRATIPMEGEVESLNAAIAGSLLAFEAARQRRAAAAGAAAETDFGSPSSDGPE